MRPDTPSSLHRSIETISLAGIELIADAAGVVYWPDEQVLAVSDLHLEKGSSYAERGMLLPPYDTAATLTRLADVVSRYAPRLVIALGDNFHDGRGALRMDAKDREALARLQQGRDWLWVAGNHDPEPAAGIGGTFAAAFALGPLSFRHEPGAGPVKGEIAGHLHPLARITQRGQTLSRRCFASNRERMIMPAFGAFAGGLNVLHRAFGEVFGAFRFTAYMLGHRRLYPVNLTRCVGD